MLHSRVRGVCAHCEQDGFQGPKSNSYHSEFALPRQRADCPTALCLHSQIKCVCSHSSYYPCQGLAYGFMRISFR